MIASSTTPTGGPAGDRRLQRLSLNQATTKRLTVAEAVAACERAGLAHIGLWREPVDAQGLDQTRRLVTAGGLQVSSLCRGGFLTGIGESARSSALQDNRRAIDEAAALAARCLVMVVGGLPEGSRDLDGARARVADALAELAPYAGSAGVRLALEPLHPMYCADRAVLSTLGQALDIAETFPPEQVGVVVDTFHVWWDPNVKTQIARAGHRIASFQVCDWILPIPADALLARGMMGDGSIDFPLLASAVEQAGYQGPIEVEIFNADVWATEPDEVVRTMCERYLNHVVGG
jgi:sugar phosphate isomerase/epimerase